MAKNRSENWIGGWIHRQESGFGGENRGNRLKIGEQRVSLAGRNSRNFSPAVPVTNQLLVIKHEFSNLFSNRKEVYITEWFFGWTWHMSIGLTAPLGSLAWSSILIAPCSWTSSHTTTTSSSSRNALREPYYTIRINKVILAYIENIETSI